MSKSFGLADSEAGFGTPLNRVVPMANYSSVVVFNQLVFTAGMTPRINGELAYQGIVGKDLNIDEARQAAVLAARRAMQAASDHLPGTVFRALSLTVFVRCGASFTQISAVADAASAVIAKSTVGPVPARAAVGVSSLPGGSPIEITLILGIGVEGEE